MYLRYRSAIPVLDREVTHTQSTVHLNIFNRKVQRMSTEKHLQCCILASWWLYLLVLLLSYYSLAK